MQHPYVVVLVTTPSRELARQIGRRLVEEKLAACANIISPIESIYTWKGEIQQEEEVLLLIKTRAELLEGSLIPAIMSIHPYEVPEIIALPIVSGSRDYLKWIEESTHSLS